MTAIDQIFDENNTDPVVLYNEHGEPVRFEQIALIPLEGQVYVILLPLQVMEGVNEGEGFVFEITQLDGEETLLLVDDFTIIDKVFDIYESLLEEA